MTIEGSGVATTGIRLNSGASLAIVNCVVRHFNGTGILLAPAAAMSFLIVNTLVLDTLSTGDGILVDPQGNGSANGVIYHVVASQNGHAIYVRGVDSTGPINVTVVNSTLSGNNGDGVIAQSISGHSATAVMVRDSISSNNGVGFSEAGPATLRLAHSVATGNDIGIQVNGGVLNSYVDNDINGNTNDNTGVLTPLAMH